MPRTHRRLVAGAGALAVLAGAAAAPVVASAAPVAPAVAGPARHVLLVSVDGLHQSDLAWYVANHPASTLAGLVRSGRSYTGASTPFPSDSFPGLTALVTGGDPKTTGIYYDVAYNPTLLPPGTTSCAGAKPGTTTSYDESIDRNTASIDAGQGLSGLPGSILSMTGSPQTLINPAALPVDPASCQAVYPHSYLKVNTVFEVARSHRLVTAWSDKHPAYDLVNGPSGVGVQDLFTPEINSTALGFPSGDWTKDNLATRQYDGYKVQAVLNEIDGYDHSHSVRVGTPAIFGMNFQAVSTAQKLATSDGLTGGYAADGTPGPLVAQALAFVDTSLARMVSQISLDGLARRTTVIVTAKHGQSPTDPAALNRVDDGPILDGLNAAWAATHPKAAPLVAHASDDDGMLLWLSNRSKKATDFARSYLLAQTGTGVAIDGSARPYTASGLSTVYAGKDAAAFVGVPAGDVRVPDVIGIGAYGTVFTGGSKIAEHGGAAADDRHVPIVVSGAGVGTPGAVGSAVETTQVAPTILRLLGLSPTELSAVRAQGTAALPGL